MRQTMNLASTPACCQSPASQSAPTSSCPPPWPASLFHLQLRNVRPTLPSDTVELTSGSLARKGRGPGWGGDISRPGCLSSQQSLLVCCISWFIETWEFPIWISTASTCWMCLYHRYKFCQLKLLVTDKHGYSKSCWKHQPVVCCIKVEFRTSKMYFSWESNYWKWVDVWKKATKPESWFLFPDFVFELSLVKGPHEFGSWVVEKLS